MDGIFECDLLCLEGTTIGARWSMPLVDEVILSEDYEIGTTILDCISNRTICEDLEVRLGNGGIGLKRKFSLLGWCHSLVNWCDDCWIGGGLSIEELKAAHRRG